MNNKAVDLAVVREAMAIADRKTAQRILLRLGRKRLGPPDETTLGLIQIILSARQLEEWIELLFDVSSWDEMLEAWYAVRKKQAPDVATQEPNLGKLVRPSG
jgi:hypothetical protein